jgi:hypothetical protein
MANLLSLSRPARESLTSGAVREARHALVFGAAGTAENSVVLLNAVANHLAAAMSTNGRQRVDGAFE